MVVLVGASSLCQLGLRGRVGRGFAVVSVGLCRRCARPSLRVPFVVSRRSKLRGRVGRGFDVVSGGGSRSCGLGSVARARCCVAIEQGECVGLRGKWDEQVPT